MKRRLFSAFVMGVLTASVWCYDLATHGYITWESHRRSALGAVDGALLRELGIPRVSGYLGLDPNQAPYRDFRIDNIGVLRYCNGLLETDVSRRLFRRIGLEELSIPWWLICGSVREDDIPGNGGLEDDPWLLSYYRVFNHFFDPLNNRALGSVLHHVQDMAQPQLNSNRIHHHFSIREVRKAYLYPVLAITDFLKLLFGGSTTLSGEALSGVVLDAATNQPLEKVVVTVEWNGSAHTIATSQAACLHAETTLTDAQGRFHFGPWEKKLDGFFKQSGAGLFTYKKGYENTRYAIALRGDDNKGQPMNSQKVVKIKPFIGSVEERFNHLKKTSPHCINHDSTFDSIVFEEQKALAVTTEQKKWIQNYESFITHENRKKNLNTVIYDRALQ